MLFVRSPVITADLSTDLLDRAQCISSQQSPSPNKPSSKQRPKSATHEFYASRLLDATGVCVIPGSGFGQKEGTLHFRTTFLAPGTEWVGKIAEFHKGFMDEFKD
jgi:alanine transaminase